jgi:hypothetical protein
MAGKSLVNSELNTDLYLCFGFAFAFCGAFLYFFFHYFDGIWWVFGGTLIFVSPFMGAFMDDELEKRRESKEFWID